MQPGVVAGAVYEFHAARAHNGTGPGHNDPAVTEAFDTSLNGNHGTLTNIAYTSAEGWNDSPPRLTLDGSGYVDCGDLSAAEGKVFTYEAWVVGSALDVAARYVIAERGDTNGLCGLQLYSGVPKLYFRNDAGSAKQVTGGTLTSGVHHLLATCDGSLIYLYLDGVSVGTPTAPPSGAATLTTTTVGSLRTANYYSGSLLVARIYPTALDADDVAQNFAAGYEWVDAPSVPRIFVPRSIPVPSLIVGSDETGYQDMGASATLGTMTRAMPGGDGSLEWTLSRKAAERHANVIAPGSKVRLYADGEAVWGGRIVNDPLSERLLVPGSVTVAAGGLNSWAARHQAYAYGALETDPEQWRVVRRQYDSAGTGELEPIVSNGRFSLDKDGHLYIEGADDRTYAAYGAAGFGYWLFNGLETGQSIVGIDVSYKCNLPGSFHFRIRSGTGNPWMDGRTNELDETTNRSSWYSRSVDLTLSDARSVVVLLQNGSSASTPATNPYVRIRSFTIHLRGSVGSVDRTVTLDEALGDIATLPGLATVTDLSTIGSSVAHLMIRPELPQSPADAQRAIAAMHTNEVEYGYYLTDDGADGFYCCELPSVVNPARNRHWDYGGRASDGESVDNLIRDAEAAPDYIAFSYLSKDVATVLNSTPMVYWYPSQPTSLTANVEAVTDYADEPLSASAAAYMAARLWVRRQGQQWTGTLPIPQTMTTVAGAHVPGYVMRPGDRVSIPGLSGASDLYVAETDWDWQTMTGTATIGWPFESKPGVYESWNAYGDRFGNWGRPASPNLPGLILS